MEEKEKAEAKSKIRNILKNKIYPRPVAQLPERSDAIFIVGLYTIGLIKNETNFVTISNQISRATDLADFLNRHPDRLKKVSDKAKRKIAIIGSGFSGLSCALALNDNFEVHVFEEQNVLCPMQRGCEIRKFYSNLHVWPKKQEVNKPEIQLFSVPDESKDSVIIPFAKRLVKLELANYDKKPVAELASYLVNSAIKMSNKDGSFNLYQDTTYLHISSKDQGSGVMHIDCVGNKLEQNGALKPEVINQDFDIVILATGFGKENSYDLKNKNIVTSYWRNDDRGQVPLYSKNSNYLVSGYGDGALNDIFRLMFYDYAPTDIINIVEEYLFAGNYDTNKLDSEIERLKDSSIKESEPRYDLYTLMSDSKIFKQDEDAYKKIKTWIRHDNKVIMHVNNQLSSFVSETVGYSEDSSSQPIKLILNNEKSMLYNRVIFYFLWKFNAIKIEVGTEIDSIASKYGIPEENIIIRHGSDKMSQLKKILSPSLLRTTDILMNEASGLRLFNQKPRLVA